jgi:hypothetical protein
MDIGDRGVNMFIQKNENVFVLTERKNDVLDYIESSKINVQLVLQLANEYTIIRR